MAFATGVWSPKGAGTKCAWEDDGGGGALNCGGIVGGPNSQIKRTANGDNKPCMR